MVNITWLRSFGLMISLFSFCFAYTQQEHAPLKKLNMDSILKRTESRIDFLSNDSIMKKLDDFSKSDTLLKKAIRDYNLFGLEHRKNSLQWNLTSSIIIFWSVILLVLSGISFAGIQFYISMQAAKRAGTGKSEDVPTQVEATLQGIKVSSPVLGVIILIISMLFFYLYLKFVYPVIEIF